MSDNAETAVLAGGCFWIMQQLLPDVFKPAIPSPSPGCPVAHGLGGSAAPSATHSAQPRRFCAPVPKDGCGGR